MMQMAEKTSPDAPPNCAVVPKIKETAKPAVSELLRRHTERPAYEHAASRRKNDLGR
jgi:hypothetical protein